MSRIWQIAREVDDAHKRRLHQSMNRPEVSGLFRILGFLVIYWLAVLGMMAALLYDPFREWLGW